MDLMCRNPVSGDTMRWVFVNVMTFLEEKQSEYRRKVGLVQWTDATGRKVMGSIPDDIIAIFYWHNLSGCTMAMGLTQPLTEMSTRNISWGYRRPVRRAGIITTFVCRLSWNFWASTSWNPQSLPRPVMGLLYLYLYITVKKHQLDRGTQDSHRHARLGFSRYHGGVDGDGI